MATFVEVTSEEKNCTVIINIDRITEIAPLITGGCALFFNDPAAPATKTPYKVKDDYSLFKQFAMQTVTAEDIAKRFPSKKEVAEKSKVEIPKL